MDNLVYFWWNNLVDFWYNNLCPGIIVQYSIDTQLTIEQCKKLKLFGLRLFTGSTAAKVRISGLQLLQQLFSPATNVDKMESAADKLEIETIVTRHLFFTLSQQARPSGSLVQVVTTPIYKFQLTITTNAKVKPSDWLLKVTFLLLTK